MKATVRAGVRLLQIGEVGLLTAAILFISAAATSLAIGDAAAQSIGNVGTVVFGAAALITVTAVTIAMVDTIAHALKPIKDPS